MVRKFSPYIVFYNYFLFFTRAFFLGGQGSKCFKAGDVRVNEHIGKWSSLSSMYNGYASALGLITMPYTGRPNGQAFLLGLMAKPFF